MTSSIFCIPLPYLSNFPLPARLMYNLGDGENWGAIAVNLLPLLAKEMQHRGEQQSQHSKAHRQVDCSSCHWCSVENLSNHVLLDFSVRAGECRLSVCRPSSASWGCASRSRTRATWRQSTASSVRNQTPLGQLVTLVSLNGFVTWTAGCSLVLTEFDVVEKMESLSKAERDFVCTLLFHTVNWFREVSSNLLSIHC